ncbi:hypothetical protein L484_024075 [Morus notabilis]|uniref:Uncharacterized protein n=1 Tax=Morus notabilis TaxID=981085 RepID=W9S0H1_9ROSA|nr:hypothetical protein L484_024075 [Morus notabilis]
MGLFDLPSSSVSGSWGQTSGRTHETNVTQVQKNEAMNSGPKKTMYYWAITAQLSNIGTSHLTMFSWKTGSFATNVRNDNLIHRLI